MFIPSFFQGFTDELIQNHGDLEVEKEAESAHTNVLEQFENDACSASGLATANIGHRHHSSLFRIHWKLIHVQRGTEARFNAHGASGNRDSTKKDTAPARYLALRGGLGAISPAETLLKSESIVPPRCVFPECVARVPVSFWGCGGRAVFAGRCVYVRNRPQPSATVRNRPQKGSLLELSSVA